MSHYNLDKFFAENSDYHVCQSWAIALDDIQVQHGSFLEDWPETWSVAWVVYTYLGIWEGDGIEALWQSNPDHISLFVKSLNIIGAEYSGDFVSRSFDAVIEFDINNYKFLNSSEFMDICEEWNMNLNYYTHGITEKLAIYLRSRRLECLPILDLLIKVPLFKTDGGFNADVEEKG